VNNGSIPTVNPAYTTGNFLAISSISLASTIQFFGVNDILLSTAIMTNSSPAIYVSISSFTSAGYLALNAETYNYPKVSVSSFSTAMAQDTSQNFTSSIPFVNVCSNTNLMSTVGGDSYVSSIVFDGTHISKYVNLNSGATRATLEFFPNFQFPNLSTTVAGTYSSDDYIKPIVSYLQIPTPTGSYIFPESITARFMYSQNLTDDNYFTDTIKMPINPYTISSYVAANLPQSTPVILYHQIVYSFCSTTTQNVGFSTPIIRNRGFSTNSLFLTINNQASLPPVRQ
jgi:hypothetical protein